MPLTLPRHRQIVQLLRDRGESSVESLAQQFGVSTMTIRRDLVSLADRGHVVRTHGGAAPAAQVSFEFQFLQRARLHGAAKDRIGATAAAMVGDGQSVLLDSGTTTLCIAAHLLNRKRVTVITTSLPIASVLQRAEGVETILLGGYVRRESPDLGGPLTESNLEKLRADIAFIGADGIDVLGNVYNSSMQVAQMLTKMIAAAGKSYVVADASKIGRTALVSFGSLAEFQGLITDATGDDASTLRSIGVNVIDCVAGQSKETVHG